MSQQQLRRPNESPDDKATKYGDVFNVSGELAAEKIAPRDAAAMQSVESSVLGETQKGGPAALMQSAADHNKAIGAVSNNEATHAAGLQGVTLAQGIAGGRRVIVEAVAGQVVGGYTEGGKPENQDQSPTPALGGSQITIGEALEAAALVAGDKPVDTSDAAAVQAAEVRATGRGQVLPRGVGARAQAAADLNPKVPEKIKLGEAIGTATAKLPVDKPVSTEDAVRVAAAEVRNDPGGDGLRPGGVASALAAAARINEMAKTP